MKKQIIAASILAAISSASFAQSSVVVYGIVDAGINKLSTGNVSVGKRAANRLGFRGVEDLGGGVKALFQLEMGFEPDTGTNESVTRPLFQGQSRVGFQGALGTVLVGRGITAYLAAKNAFDPWNGSPSVAGFKADVMVAGYNSQPLDPAGSSNERINNAIWYTAPAIGGWQLSGTVGSREANGGGAFIGRGTAANPQYAAGATGSVNPYSIAAGYKMDQFAALVGYERNMVESKLIAAHLSVMATPVVKLMASYAKQTQDHTKLINTGTKGWVVGANYTVGSGKFLAGIGHKKPDGVVKTKQVSLGYEHSLSKRTYLYAELSKKTAATSVRFYGVGVNHSF